jgi:hypothetical protein
MTDESKGSRREFVRKLVYASPLIITLPAAPALATVASPPRDQDQGFDVDHTWDTDVNTHDVDPPASQPPPASVPVDPPPSSEPARPKRRG